MNEQRSEDQPQARPAADHPQAGPAGGGPAAPQAPAGHGAEELVLEAEAACSLLSEHGGEIVITDDGRVVFMNASEHLVELAHALQPDNPEVAARMELIRRVRAERAGRAAGATSASAASEPAGQDGGPAG
ncbi:MAG: hypothetical protein KatS3mg102_1240 [Planctomycetota bacterium]|nr:MAG: hypothetical protein KatS3mg102_1240 [Planctomycetota bacterium]